MGTKSAKVVKTIDTNYKNGFVQCKGCGWKKEFGDGFNQHFIESCPNCDSSITTRIQNQLVTGGGGRGRVLVQKGFFYYFQISNGIHAQYRPSIVNESYYKVN